MPHTPRLYLGIDAGATKTHALIADEEGRVHGGGRAGPGNWEGVGLEGAYQAYNKALNQALAVNGLQVGELCGAGYALAGLDWPGDLARLEAVVARLGVPGPRVLVNDTFGALRAGTADGVGVVIIAGTGANVAGCNQRGERFRTYGEGPNFGDLGGAGDIVTLALRAVAMAHTGRNGPTALTERFCRLYDARDTIDLLEKILRGHAERPRAALAPMVFEVAAAGDAVAQEVIRHAGSEQGQNAAAVARRLGLSGTPFTLVLAGGVFRSQDPLLLEAILAPVRAESPAVQHVVLSTPPVVGAVLLAMEAAGITVTPALHERIAAQALANLP